MGVRPPALVRALIVSTIALALVATPVHAQTAPGDRTELLSRAQSELDAGNFRAAAESYAAYYEALGDDRTTVAGENAVLVAADAYRQAWDAGADRADLLAARTLLQAHIGDFTAATGSDSGEGVDEAKAELSWFQDKLEQTAPAPEPAPVPAAPPDETPTEPVTKGPTRRPDPAPPPPPIVEDTPEPSKGGPDKVGLGLTIGGAASVAAGIFGLTYGSLYIRAVDDTADTAMPGVNQPANFDPEAWRDDGHKVGRGLQIGGGIVLAIGGGLLAYGIVRLVAHSRGKAAARLSRPRRAPARL